MWTAVIALGIGLLLVDLLTHVVAARLALPIFEKPPMFGVRRFRPDPEAEPFFTRTQDGIRLAGCVFRPASGMPVGLVVFCPELGSDRWSAAWYCRGLLEAGYAVVSFDFANQGDSDSRPSYAPIHWPTEYEAADVQAVLTWVRQQNEFRNLPIGLFGVSRGGGAAMVAAARSEHVRAVAADSAFSVQGMLVHYTLRWSRLYFPGWFMDRCPKWHISLTMRLVEWMSARRLRCRYLSLEHHARELLTKGVLLISGSSDTYVAPEVVEGLRDSLGGDPRRLWMVPGAKHNMARGTDPARYDQRVVEFFNAALEPAVPETAPRLVA